MTTTEESEEKRKSKKKLVQGEEIRNSIEYPIYRFHNFISFSLRKHPIEITIERVSSANSPGTPKNPRYSLLLFILLAFSLRFLDKKWRTNKRRQEQRKRQRKSATIRLIGDNFDEHYCERSAQEEKRIIGYPRIEVEVKTASLAREELDIVQREPS